MIAFHDRMKKKRDGRIQERRRHNLILMDFVSKNFDQQNTYQKK